MPDKNMVTYNQDSIIIFILYSLFNECFIMITYLYKKKHSYDWVEFFYNPIPFVQSINFNIFDLFFNPRSETIWDLLFYKLEINKIKVNNLI